MNHRILERSEHPISRNDFSEEALKVLYRLDDQGYTAYLAGGCVRDLLLERHPKDFDVVTDAKPNELKKIFRNCRLIGRRFRLAHIFFRDMIIEVATFRSNVPEGDDVKEGHVHKKDGVVIRDNLYGSPEEDAMRRDFTINAMFYDISTFSIIDYAGGLEDIEKRVVRCIGDPAVRYREDPVRMIRAIRFASSLDLTIEEKSWKGILETASHIATASHARMYEEMLKFFYSGALTQALHLLRESGLLDYIFPDWAKWLNEEASESDLKWVERVTKLMDNCKAKGFIEAPALLYSLLFGSYHEYLAQPAIETGVDYGLAMEEAIRLHMGKLADFVFIPQRDVSRIVKIARGQKRFRVTDDKHAKNFRSRDYFYDAFTYFKFSSRMIDKHNNRVTWWEEVMSEGKKRKKKRRRKKRKGSGNKPIDSENKPEGPPAE